MRLHGLYVEEPRAEEPCILKHRGCAVADLHGLGDRSGQHNGSLGVAPVRSPLGVAVSDRPTIVLADDHALVAAGLKRLLEPEFDLLAIVGDGRALLGVVRDLRPDVVITDITMPSLNGLEAARKLDESAYTPLIIFLTMHADVTLAVEAFRVGASGYLLKQSAANELLTAVWDVLEGRTYVTTLIRDEVEAALARSGSRRRKTPPLTNRQREVLQLVGEGRSIKRIAAILDISPKTVEFHKQNIRQTLGLRSTAELTQYAMRHGIVGP